MKEGPQLSSALTIVCFGFLILASQKRGVLGVHVKTRAGIERNALRQRSRVGGKPIVLSPKPIVLSADPSTTNVVFVHATNEIPKGGPLRYGDLPEDKMYAGVLPSTPRPMVHMVMNGLVEGHALGNWEFDPIAIIFPSSPDLLSLSYGGNDQDWMFINIPRCARGCVPNDKLYAGAVMVIRKSWLQNERNRVNSEEGIKVFRATGGTVVEFDDAVAEELVDFGGDPSEELDGLVEDRLSAMRFEVRDGLMKMPLRAAVDKAIVDHFPNVRPIRMCVQADVDALEEQHRAAMSTAIELEERRAAHHGQNIVRQLSCSGEGAAMVVIDERGMRDALKGIGVYPMMMDFGNMRVHEATRFHGYFTQAGVGTCSLAASIEVFEKSFFSQDGWQKAWPSLTGFFEKYDEYSRMLDESAEEYKFSLGNQMYPPGIVVAAAMVKFLSSLPRPPGAPPEAPLHVWRYLTVNLKNWIGQMGVFAEFRFQVHMCGKKSYVTSIVDMLERAGQVQETVIALVQHYDTMDACAFQEIIDSMLLMEKPDAANVEIGGGASASPREKKRLKLCASVSEGGSAMASSAVASTDTAGSIIDGAQTRCNGPVESGESGGAPLAVRLPYCENATSFPDFGDEPQMNMECGSVEMVPRRLPSQFRGDVDATAATPSPTGEAEELAF